MATPGTMSIRRQRASTSAVSFFETHEAELATGAEERLLPFLEEGEAKPEFGSTMKLFTRLMQNNFAAVVSTDKAVYEEETESFSLREDLEEAGAEVRSQLVNVRQVLAGLYGDGRARKLVAVDGSTGQVAEPERLWRQGEHTVELLTSGRFEEPRKKTKSVSFQPLDLAEELQPAVVKLAEAHKAVVDQRKKLEGAQAAKAKAIEDFDVDYRAAVRFGVSVSRLAGRPDLARKLTTSDLRRPKRGASDEESSSPAPEEDTQSNPAEAPSPEGGDSAGEEAEAS